eukprot:TRINITY_DN39526_c0_g1_i1.p2 TRINITY_DN39526_c0_g1~~TRINITY_DN39526_c0_g1_i1.p2  ORF type:complete len:438 (+),score=139.16 TRINITY_DN39526_c0_g1_i1:104-1315(+)
MLEPRLAAAVGAARRPRPPRPRRALQQQRRRQAAQPWQEKRALALATLERMQEAAARGVCAGTHADDLDLDGKVDRDELAVAAQRTAAEAARMERQCRDLRKPCKIIDGREAAQEVLGEVRQRVALHRATRPGIPPPALAVLLVGQRADSSAYVQAKERACAQVGINSVTFRFAADITEAELLRQIDRINKDSAWCGMLVQLPLPDHIHTDRVLHAIDFVKDVDGFHPRNVGLLAQGSAEAMVACTPKGCMDLLRRSGVSVAGKHCVVLGKSNIVGLPMALLLLNANASVEICHRLGCGGGIDLAATARTADIIVCAAGCPGLVDAKFIKPGAIVIDVGINWIDDPGRRSGRRLVGDAVFEDCLALCSLATPVPGGVGPMTVAMLMKNSLLAYERQWGLDEAW